MKDRELPEWTGKGQEYGGFYVATLSDLVVGTVAYQTTKWNNTLDMFRLSVDKDYRKLGVAAALVQKMEVIARQNGCGVVEAMTSDAQLAAMRFYPRQGYKHESSRRYLQWTDFIHQNVFRKHVK